jgi:sec-independent protein translocase protein TatA
MAGIGIWQLIIILVIVLLLFGTKRLKNLGGDLGGAIKGFKGAMQKGEDEKATDDQTSVANDDSEKSSTH